MSLPVSQYEALLAEVRGLRRRAQHVQQLVNPFISASSSQNSNSNVSFIFIQNNNKLIECGY